MKFSLKSFFVLIVLIIAFNIYSQSQVGRIQNPLSVFGAKDFIAFWSAGRAFVQGVNPYSSEVLLPIQRNVISLDSVQQFLNIPGSLIFFIPASLLPFELARLAWIILNAYFLFIIVQKLINVVSSQHSVKINNYFFLFLTSPPVLLCIWFGQLSLVLLYCSLLSFESMKDKNWLKASIYTLPLFIKPHLFLGIFAVFFFEGINLKKYAALCAFMIFIFLQNFLVFLFQNNIFRWYGESIPYATQYHTPTFAKLLQLGLHIENPLFLTLLVCVVVYCGYTLLSKREFFLQNVSINKYSILLFCSLIAAPYAWVYDFVLLIPLQCALLHQLNSTSVDTTASAVRRVFIFPSIIFIILATCDPHMRIQVWYPFYFLILWFHSNMKFSQQKV